MSFHDPKAPVAAKAPAEAQPIYYTPEPTPRAAEVKPLAALEQMFGYYG